MTSGKAAIGGFLLLLKGVDQVLIHIKGREAPTVAQPRRMPWVAIYRQRTEMQPLRMVDLFANLGKRICQIWPQRDVLAPGGPERGFTIGRELLNGREVVLHQLRVFGDREAVGFGGSLRIEMSYDKTVVAILRGGFPDLAERLVSLFLLGGVGVQSDHDNFPFAISTSMEHRRVVGVGLVEIDFVGCPT